MNDPDSITLAEAASRLSCSMPTLLPFVKAGELAAFIPRGCVVGKGHESLGKGLRVYTVDFRAFVDSKARRFSETRTPPPYTPRGRHWRDVAPELVDKRRRSTPRPVKVPKPRKPAEVKRSRVNQFDLVELRKRLGG